MTWCSNIIHRLFHNVACTVHVLQAIIYKLTQNCAHVAGFTLFTGHEGL
jgi:hypothetical protein